MRTQPVRVAIDLETTGLHPEQDAVIEIGALKFAGDEVIDTFSTLVAPGVPIPYRIQRLTHITPAQLTGAPQMAEVLPTLRAFLGDFPLVGHSVPFDAAFLRRVGLARRNPLVDTYELASALLPNLASYTLASVSAALGVQSSVYHRALADAQLARDVFLALLARLDSLSIGTLEALERLATPPDWTPGYFVRAAARAQRGALNRPTHAGHSSLAGTTLGDQLADKLGVNPAVLSLAITPDAPTPLSRALISVAPSPVATPPAASIDARAQHAISTDVCTTLADGGTLVIEALQDDATLRACLVPALTWAHAQQQRVLVSVADSDAMGRLVRRVLPAALTTAGLTPQDLPIAEVGEPESYLCVHRWLGDARTSRDGLLPRDLARGLAKLTVWAAQTEVGARAEVSLQGQELQAWERARGGIEFADTSANCAYRRDGYCFLTRAQQTAERAKVVVTTHAALARHLSHEDDLLPDAARVLVLDAHLLEDELRRAQSIAFDQASLLGKLMLLAEVEPGGLRAGLLHLAASRVTRAGEPIHETAWFAQVARARQGVEALFGALRTVLVEAQTDGGGYGDAPEQRTIRVDGRTRQQASWLSVTRAWAHVDERLGAVAKLVREVAQQIVSAHGAHANAASDGVATDLLASARLLERTQRQGTQVFGAGTDENRVYWLRIPYVVPGAPLQAVSEFHHTATNAAQAANTSSARGQADATVRVTSATSAPPQLSAEVAEVPTLHSAPIRVGGLLAPLCAPDHGLVLVGSALAVAGDFSYLRGSLGLPEQTQTLEPARDRTSQTLLCLPSDVPEPNAPQYQRHLDDALVRLASTLGGKLVAIFPSHAALRASALGIRRALERQDIMVLAQGQDGSARQLWQTFRSEQRVVLLGAGSFWEGAEQADVPPACVVVTRIPFPALGDPLLAARADTWADQQNQFVVPHAALRLRLALGGLAWSHWQRNAVVIFDRRVQTRDYGSTILNSLARCTPYQEPMAQIVERVGEWVTEPSFGPPQH